MTLGWKPVGIDKPLPLGTPVKPDERLSWPKTIGVGRAARRRDVRRDVRLPDHHGAGPEPGDHDVRGLHDPVPADRVRKGAVLPGHVGELRRRGGGDPRGRRQYGVGHRRDPGRRTHPGDRRHHRAHRRRAGGAQGAAAGGQRRGGDADRVQPRARRRRGLLAAGSGRRADRHGVHHPGRGRVPRILLPDRGLPRVDLRLRAVLGRWTRSSGRSPRRRRPARSPRTCGSTCPACRTPPGSASRPCTPPSSRCSSSCSRCPA